MTEKVEVNKYYNIQFVYDLGPALELLKRFREAKVLQFFSERIELYFTVQDEESAREIERICQEMDLAIHEAD